MSCAIAFSFFSETTTGVCMSGRGIKGVEKKGSFQLKPIWTPFSFLSEPALINLVPNINDNGCRQQPKASADT